MDGVCEMMINTIVPSGEGDLAIETAWPHKGHGFKTIIGILVSARKDLYAQLRIFGLQPLIDFSHLVLDEVRCLYHPIDQPVPQYCSLGV